MTVDLPSDERTHRGIPYGQYCTDNDCPCQAEPYRGVMGTKRQETSNSNYGRKVPDFFGRLYTDTETNGVAGTWVRRAEVDALLDEIKMLRLRLETRELNDLVQKHCSDDTTAHETCDSDGVIELLQYLDPGCCDCQPCHQCGRMPVECSGTECASTCQCSECGHCRIEYTIASMRLAQKATTETRAFPQAPDTDERYNVSEGLLETLIEVAQDNGFRDVVEALRELQFRRGRHSQKASEQRTAAEEWENAKAVMSGEMPPCECTLRDKAPSAYHNAKCPRYVADKL